MVEEDLGPAAEKAKRELKGDIDYEFIQYDDLPRVFKEQFDGLYVRPILVLTGGMTSDNQPGPALIDANNRFDVVTSPGIGAGRVRAIQGIFTKNATGTTGGLVVTPAADDVIYFLYGIVVVGATHAGAASPLHAGIAKGNSYTDFMQVHLHDATADVDEVFFIPALGEANTGPDKTSGAYQQFQMMMPSTTMFTADLGSPGPARYVITYQTMANSEELVFQLHFLSMNNQPLTVTPLTGAFS